jgi:hypothetical protein
MHRGSKILNQRLWPFPEARMTTKSTLSRSCLTAFILRVEIPLCGELGDFARRRLRQRSLAALHVAGRGRARKSLVSRCNSLLQFSNSLLPQVGNIGPSLLILRSNSRCQNGKKQPSPCRIPCTSAFFCGGSLGQNRGPLRLPHPYPEIKSGRLGGRRDRELARAGPQGLADRLSRVSTRPSA